MNDEVWYYADRAQRAEAALADLRTRLLALAKQWDTPDYIAGEYYANVLRLLLLADGRGERD